MKKFYYLILGVLLLPLLVSAASKIDTNLVNRLKGRILLQTQQHGEAWFIHPVDGKRYYLKDGATAYEMLRKFGLGITDGDLEKIPIGSLESINIGQNKSNQSSPNNVAQDTQSLGVMKIDGLTAIRISGGIWNNWDSDIENDGAVINIIYLDNQSNIITNDMTRKLPITASIKVYSTRTVGFNVLKDKLVFSSDYPKEKIILGEIYPSIRIPKEEILVNPNTDYKYGIVEVTINTPSQGSFSASSDFIVLYE